MNDDARVSAHSPWPGLNAFTEQLQAYFHGRRQEADELFRRVTRGPLTVLFGQSGLGKTSLVQAGLFPRLRHEGFLPVTVRLDFSAGAPPLTRQVFAELATAFEEAELSALPPLSPGESLWEYFRRRDNVLAGADGTITSVVLAFDQFEELFTLGEADTADRAGKAAFISELADLVENRLPRRLAEQCERDDHLAEGFVFDRDELRILICLREDYLPHLEDLRASMPSVAENRIRLTRLNGRQALEAVLGPGEAVVSPEVARQIVCFVAGGADSDDKNNGEGLGTGPDFARLEVEPAMLSLFCRELNDQRRERNLPQITPDLLAGNRTRIIQDFYQRCIADQPTVVRHFIEDELLTGDGYRDAVALDRARRILSDHGAPAKAIDALVDRRLLHVEERGHVRRVELTHDLLVGVVKASRADRELTELKSRAAAELAAVRRRARRRVYFALSISAVAVVLAAMVIYWKSLSDRVAASLRVYEENRYATDMWLAQQAADQGNIGRAISLVQRHLADEQGADLHDFQLRHLCWICQGDSVATYRDRTSQYHFNSVAFSPDGQLLATAGEDGTILLHDTSRLDQAPTAIEKLKQSVQALEFSGDHRYLACATGNWRTTAEDCKVHLWDLAKRRFVAVLSDETEHASAKRMKTINTVIFSADGKLIATASEDNQARVWKLGADGYKLMATLVGYDKGANDVAFDPDSHLLAIGWGLGHLQVWNVAGEQPVKQIDYSGREIDSGVTALAFAREGRTIVVGLRDGPIRYWDVEKQEFGDPIDAGQGVVEWLRVSHDGKQFITAGGNGTIVLWDFDTHQPLYRFRGHRDVVYTVAFAHDGRRFASASADGTVKLWDTEHRRRVATLEHQGIVEGLAFSPDGKHLATAVGRVHDGEPEGQVCLWNMPSRTREAVLAGHTDDVNSVSFSPDGDLLASGSSDQTVILWDVAGKRRKTALPIADKSGMTAVAFSPNRKVRTLATGSRLGAVTLWTGDANGNWTSRELGKHTNVVASLAFSPDGALLASAGQDWTVGLWDVATGKSRAQLKGHQGSCYTVQFSPDGALLASGSHDRTIRLWDVKRSRFEPTEAVELPAYESSIKALDFSRDGTVLAGGSQESTITLWRVNTGSELAVLRGHTGGVLSAAFSPDGTILATGGTDQTVRLWETATIEEIESLFKPKTGWSKP